MNTTFAQDIAIIATRLNGNVEFSNIKFDQCLVCEDYREKSVNNVVFVTKAYGVYFYTTRTAMENMVMLNAPKEMPIMVGCENSLNLYRITQW